MLGIYLNLILTSIYVQSVFSFKHLSLFENRYFSYTYQSSIRQRASSTTFSTSNSDQHLRDVIQSNEYNKSIESIAPNKFLNLEYLSDIWKKKKRSSMEKAITNFISMIENKSQPPPLIRNKSFNFLLKFGFELQNRIAVNKLIDFLSNIARNPTNTLRIEFENTSSLIIAIKGYEETGEIESCRRVFSLWPFFSSSLINSTTACNISECADVPLLNTFLLALIRTKQPQTDIFHYYNYMISNGLTDSYTPGTIMEFCVQTQNLDLARQVFYNLTQSLATLPKYPHSKDRSNGGTASSVSSDWSGYSAVTSMMIRCFLLKKQPGSDQEAVKLLRWYLEKTTFSTCEIPGPDEPGLAVLSATLHSLASNGHRTDLALSLYRDVKQKIATACEGAHRKVDILQLMEKPLTSMLSGYLGSGNPDATIFCYFATQDGAVLERLVSGHLEPSPPFIVGPMRPFNLAVSAATVFARSSTSLGNERAKGQRTQLAARVAVPDSVTRLLQSSTVWRFLCDVWKLRLHHRFAQQRFLAFDESTVTNLLDGCTVFGDSIFACSVLKSYREAQSRHSRHDRKHVLQPYTSVSPASLEFEARHADGPMDSQRNVAKRETESYHSRQSLPLSRVPDRILSSYLRCLRSPSSTHQLVSFLVDLLGAEQGSGVTTLEMGSEDDVIKQADYEKDRRNFRGPLGAIPEYFVLSKRLCDEILNSCLRVSGSRLAIRVFEILLELSADQSSLIRLEGPGISDYSLRNSLVYFERYWREESQRGDVPVTEGSDIYRVTHRTLQSDLLACVSNRSSVIVSEAQNVLHFLRAQWQLGQFICPTCWASLCGVLLSRGHPEAAHQVLVTLLSPPRCTHSGPQSKYEGSSSTYSYSAAEIARVATGAVALAADPSLPLLTRDGVQNLNHIQSSLIDGSSLSQALSSIPSTHKFQHFSHRTSSTLEDVVTFLECCSLPNKTDTEFTGRVPLPVSLLQGIFLDATSAMSNEGTGRRILRDERKCGSRIIRLLESSRIILDIRKSLVFTKDLSSESKQIKHVTPTHRLGDISVEPNSSDGGASTSKGGLSNVDVIRRDLARIWVAILLKTSLKGIGSEVTSSLRLLKMKKILEELDADPNNF